MHLDPVGSSPRVNREEIRWLNLILFFFRDSALLPVKIERFWNENTRIDPRNAMTQVAFSQSRESREFGMFIAFRNGEIQRARPGAKQNLVLFG
jgi:hypothetical protein